MHTLVTSSDITPSGRREQRMRDAVRAVDPALTVQADEHGCRLLAPLDLLKRPGGPVATQRGATAFWRELRARRPLGRPRSSELSAVLNVVRCTPRQRATFERLGGAAWLREQLDAAAGDE